MVTTESDTVTSLSDEICSFLGPSREYYFTLKDCHGTGGNGNGMIFFFFFARAYPISLSCYKQENLVSEH